MKRFTILATIAGLILFSAVLAVSGLDDVLGAVRLAGWATVLVVIIRAVALVFDGLGWWLLFPPAERLSAGWSVGIRTIREGINQLLPVAAVGGDFVGARLTTFRGIGGAVAGASVLADVAVQAATQLAFAITGLALLVFLTGDSEVARFTGAGLALASVGIGAFLFLQRKGAARFLTAIGRTLAGGKEWGGLATIERVYAALGDIYRDRGTVAVSAALHMAVWIFGSLEVWVALHFMGHPVSFAEAVVIESLGQAVRGAAFAVPGGLGVQEGGYVAVCAMFGVPPGTAVALSLLKRVADLALGLPALAAWQAIESRRAFRPAAGA